MALEISYWTGYDPITRQAYGTCISRVSYTVTASSVSVGTPPANAAIARLRAGEACCVSNNGADASATNGVYLGVGDVIDLAVNQASPIEAITA